MKRTPLKRPVIRKLRDDEPIPAGAPKRYRNGVGYIRLRWLVAPNQYVEAFEHGIAAGRPGPGLEVHHLNGVKDDNRPENLQVLTKSEHAKVHGAQHGPGKWHPYRSKQAYEKAQRRLAREQARRDEVARMRDLYLSGKTTGEIGEIVGIDESNVYRRLAAAGVRMRAPIDYASSLDVDHVVQQYEAGRGIKAIAREAGVGANRVRDALQAAGVALRKPGRPKERTTWTEDHGRKVVLARSEGACEVRVEGVCSGRAREWQHRLPRSRGGTWAPSNGLHLCSPCHQFIHGNPEIATAKGWTVESGADPALKPVEVWMWGHMQAFALLDDKGDFHYPKAGAA